MTDALADDLLLARLEEALGGDAASTPSPESVHALRRAVIARAAPHPPSRRPVRWWTRARLAVAAVIGTTALGAGVAFAAGAPLPGPLRSLASDLGLPVDSPSVSATRHAEKALEHDLRLARTGGPHSAADAAVARDAGNLSRHLAGLGGSERSRLGMTPVSLLVQAHQLAPTVTVPVPAASGPGPTVPSTSPTTTPPPSTTVPAVSVPTVTEPTITLPGGGVSVPSQGSQVTVPTPPGPTK